MSPIDPRPDDQHITADRPGSVPPTSGITAELPPEPMHLATPRPAHPGIWWCLGIFLVTQLPVAVLVYIILLITDAMPALASGIPWTRVGGAIIALIAFCI